MQDGWTENGATGNRATNDTPDTTGGISLIPQAISPVLSEDLPSGNWSQRVPRTLHRDLIRLAERERVSLNLLVTSLLSEAIGARRPRTRPDGHGGMLRPRRV